MSVRQLRPKTGLKSRTGEKKNKRCLSPPIVFAEHRYAQLPQVRDGPMACGCVCEACPARGWPLCPLAHSIIDLETRAALPFKNCSSFFFLVEPCPTLGKVIRKGFLDDYAESRFERISTQHALYLVAISC
jgi:hypothetical protein